VCYHIIRKQEALKRRGWLRVINFDLPKRGKKEGLSRILRDQNVKAFLYSGIWQSPTFLVLLDSNPCGAMKKPPRPQSLYSRIRYLTSFSFPSLDLQTVEGKK